MGRRRRAFLLALGLAALGMAGSGPDAQAAADLFIKDCPADTGVEPNISCAAYYLSEDMWVRQTPMSGYQLAPFVADPAWLTALSPLHQNPEYRDPKFSRPNYVYVRVRNRGSSASTGTERLRVYWAKASTGLSWPNQWVDYVANNCALPQPSLYGIEITKPRKNAATASASERTDYVNAINAIDGASYQWLMDTVTYWDKQDQVHQLAPEHGTPAFLPWHREFIHRYEVLLREANPIVTLLYWDWTTDPANSTGGFNLMTTAFMGTANGVVGAPFTTLHAGGVCANSRNGFVQPGGPNCNLHFNDWTYPPPNLYRSKSAGAPGVASDASVLAPTLYENFDNLEGNPHGNAHVYMGGNMGSVPTATEDPFFFLLHANCDRLWAQWQRTNSLAFLGRLNPGTAYNGESGNARINATMQPWDGSSGVPPWTPGVGSYTYAKTPKDPSVVFAPVYDTVPLRIPVLQAGESIVFEIPWYPPNPANFACFGADQGHVCLLARIETSPTAPYGMTFPETANLGDNVRNNNNIAWKNVTVQDNFPGLLFVGSVLLRNVARELAPTRLVLRIPPEERNNPVLAYGAVYLDLGRDLFDRWRQAGGISQGLEPLPDGRLQLFSPDAFLAGLPLESNEVQQVRLQLGLNPQYRHPDGQTFNVDLEQYGLPNQPDGFVGGQRFTFDFNKLTLVPKGAADWRYLDTGEYPGDAWPAPNYDDTKWRSGQAELGFGDDPMTTIDGGPADRRHITTWFRRTFLVADDPSIYRSLILSLKLDDGGIVYLNGHEIYRANLPPASGPNTLADKEVQGAQEETWIVVPVPDAMGLLRPGVNQLAAEVHQSSVTSDDLTFDLELAANTLAVPLLRPPTITFVAPLAGSLHLAGRPILLEVDAVDPGGQVASVTFFADGQPLGILTQPPYRWDWNGASVGNHQISALALDSDGLGTTAFVAVQVLSNVPPSVVITSPANGTMLDTSNHLQVAVVASDLGGTVQRVDFYLRHHHAFGVGDLVATATAEPFTADLGTLGPEDYVVTAVATDNGGASEISTPVHVTVVGNAPMLMVQWMGNEIMVSWTPPGAVLQEAESPLGPWNDRPDVTSPLMVAPTAKPRFYRAYLP